MSSLFGTLVSGLFGVLKQVLLPLLSYFQGKKTAKLEEKEEALKDAKKAQKDKHNITRLNGHSLESIVYDDEHR